MYGTYEDELLDIARQIKSLLENASGVDHWPTREQMRGWIDTIEVAAARLSISDDEG